jgi:hypothetical protein
VISLRLALQLRARAMPAAAAVVCRSLAKHSSWVLDPHFAAMLVRDSRTSSANGAFGRMLHGHWRTLSELPMSSFLMQVKELSASNLFI